MKKLLALILCLSMALGTVAFATETELNKDVMEGQTTVSLTIDPEANEFVVVIPATVTIDPETKRGSCDVTLKAGWKLVSCNGLRVRIKELTNGVAKSSPYFTLKNGEGTSIGYSIYGLRAGSSKLYNLCLQDAHDSGDEVWSSKWNTFDLVSVTKTQSNQDDLTGNLSIRLSTLPTEPGEYTDTITFAIELY